MENQPTDTPITDTPTPPPISAARLAANRANARRSTGPRTPQGKARSASNSLKHGLFSLENFEDFIHNHDVGLAVVDNLLAEYDPVTPTENILVHQLVHFQLRFLQMEQLLNLAMSGTAEDFIARPTAGVQIIFRELDRYSNKIVKTIKAIREEQLRRDSNTEIEPIADLPPLPEHGPDLDTDPAAAQARKESNRLTGLTIFRCFGERLMRRYGPSHSVLNQEELSVAVNNEALAIVDQIYPPAGS